MNIKSQLVILCLIFCILMSFSAVSATDINDTQMTFSSEDSGISADSLNYNEDISNDTLKVSDASVNSLNVYGDEDYTHLYFNASASSNGNGSINSPFKDFRGIANYLWDKVALHFSSGVYSLNYTFHLNYPNSLIFREDIQIIGENRENTILNFNGGLLVQNRNNGHVLLENLTLCNTTLTSWSNNEIDCRNVIFLNSTANSESNNQGGAIFTYGDLKLNNCVFMNNHADDYGGAIFVLNDIEIINSSFINNSADAGGGAIFIYEGNVKVDGSSFINNSADGDGGAIYPYVGTTEVNDSSFISNSALNEGGSIYSINLTSVKNSNFINNSALGGGAISSCSYYINIFNSNFTSNHATSFGGAISTKYAISGFKCDESNFINNSAGVSAGALYSIYSSNDFSNSNFINCSSLFGGAICDLRSNSSFFTNLKFSSNKANKGGAIYKFFAATDIVQTDFNLNSAYEGGAIYINSIDSCDLHDVSFKDNLFDDMYSVNNNDGAVSGFENDLDKLSYLNLTRASDDYIIFELDEEDVDIGQSSYDLRDYDLVSPVKDQKVDGNCWSFASIAALESCIIKANGTVYDFSEQNMKNIAASFSDYGTLSYETNDGGNSWMAVGYLSSWLGPIFDEKDIYSSNVLSSLYNTSTHIQNILFIPRNSYEDNNAIKTALMKYGAVATSMFYDDYYLADDLISYYCDSRYLDTNHAVTIVGWDDNYDCTKFRDGPNKNGAFIVKNSWGPDWGEDGYFYVSYYDKMFTHIGNNDFGPSMSYTFILNDTNHYEKNYQHQILINTHSNINYNESIMFKNVFTGESDELISAVSTYFWGNYSYELYIVVNDEIKYNQSGSLSNGYYTIPLTKQVPIKKDDKFEVIFKFMSNDESYPEICLFSNNFQNLRLPNQVSFCRPNEDYEWNVFDNSIAPIKAFSNNGRLNTTLTVEGLDDAFEINEEYNLKAIVKDQYGDLVNEGNVTFSVDGKNYSTNLVEGIANQTLIFDNPGIHKILILFNDTQYYYPSNITGLNMDVINTSLEIVKSNINVDVSDFNKGGSTQANITVNSDATGTILVKIDNKEITTLTINNGQCNYLIKDLTVGTHTIEAIYSGDNKYNSTSASTTFKVNKAKTSITAPDVSIAYKDTDGELLATIINEHGKALVVTLNVDLNGKTYTVRTDSNGQASIPLDTLKAGKYTATISYKGSGNYKASTTTAKITINKAKTSITAQDVSIAYKDTNSELVTTIISEHGKALVVTLNVDLNGKTYTVRTDSNGQASIPLDTLKAGKYTATISYKGSGNYKASTTTAKITINKAKTSITAQDVSIAYKDTDGKLVASVVSEHGKALVVTLNVDLNGKTYTVRTDSNGQASIPLDTLKAGKYTATISYKGSGNYKASTTTAKITINKAKTSITAQDVSIAYKDTDGKLVASVVSEHGKALVVTLNVDLNGKTYTVRTDSNGQASIPLDTLKPGTYTATISYKSSGNYKASSTVVKVTVVKAGTIISAPDVVAYKDTNGKLVSTVTNEHGKALVVTLNVDLNGKTYTVRTNSNGQASIPVDTLKPGTYTAIISYKGSGNYKASSTVVKVTVTEVVTSFSFPDVSVGYCGVDSNTQISVSTAKLPPEALH